MVVTFRRLLNLLSSQHSLSRSLTFYPYLNYPLQDDWDFDQRFDDAQLPFTQDSPLIAQFFSNNIEQSHSLLSVQYGNFVDVYGSNDDYRAKFDVVVTCFFIDTASNVYEYLAVIAHVLKLGGVWINAGPLHYHRSAIPYSFKHLLRVISAGGFDSLHSSTVQASYCGDDHISMKPEMYNVPLTAFRYAREEDKFPLS